MARVLLLYGTTEGQTATIAERIADVLADNGHEPTLVHTKHLPDGFSLGDYDAAVIGASIHAGTHQKYVREFVKAHAAELNEMPSAFYSVSLTAATGTQEAWDTAREMLEDFLAETGWEPDATAVVPGALKYSEYGVLKRFMMKRIAGEAGGDTDTSRDYEYTDWNEVAEFAKEFGESLNTE
ncbi:menaquinone-dependent protoporphyrinogen IX dehydrogenase [Halorussus halophilus]|uniref:menaquinone-dependent protoporphyrinogen IX dehydrogenase n=1 Tax=Halorussus halophilus TaxID=2650975 RepID=UPI00130122C4|nr:menaquinone-dependent protoporphyrinogen IX dehydrogenase [Halorussus halophilus]